MNPDLRSVEAARVLAEETIALWHHGQATERDANAAIRYAELALKTYLENLKRG